MTMCGYVVALPSGEVEIGNVYPAAVVDLEIHIELLIEVAVVQVTLPVDG